MRIQSYICACLQVVAIGTVFLAPLNTGAQPAQMTFSRLTVDDGLSNNIVLSLAQDRRGFVWVGTNDGLNRYDGYSFTTFRHDPRDSSSLSNSEITALLIGRGGHLWVGTNSGLNRFDPQRSGFSKFDVETTGSGRGLRNRRITVLKEDRSGTLWVGTTAGLFRFDPKAGAFRMVRYRGASQFGQDYISALYEDANGLFFVGTANGLNVLNGLRMEYHAYPLPGGELIHDEVRDVLRDPRGTLWVATVRRGLYQVERSKVVHFAHSASASRGLPGNSVRDLHFQEGRLLVGTSDGLAILNPETGVFTTFTTEYGNPGTLSFPSIRVILEDSRHNLWIGTWGGLNYYDRVGDRFHHVRRGSPTGGLRDDMVSSFASDPSGGIWVGTELGGLHHYDPVNNRVRAVVGGPGGAASLGSNNVKALLTDSKGLLWIGTHDGGLSRLDPRTGQLKRFSNNPQDPTSLPGDRVYVIYEDRQGQVWLGTNKNGVARYDQTTDRFVRYEADGRPGSLSANQVNAVYEDHLGNLWVGTVRGLNLFDRRTGRFTVFIPEHNNASSLIDPSVRSIFEDAAGRMWIGTSGGLELFDRRKGTFVHFTTNEGLPNNAINCILEDRKHALWISTNQGLARFDPTTRQFRTFDRRDRLQSGQFNVNACMASENGVLYFGGINGFSSFDPDRISLNRNVPPVYLTGFRLFNRPVVVGAKRSPLQKPIIETESITLRHDQNVVSIDFVALNYTLPSKNEYAFMMEGFEDDWNYVGQQRSATYTNLPAGKYIFRVRAANNDGVWNNEGATLAIRVLPPPWKTWWAVMIYLLVVGAILYSIQRYAIKMLRLQSRLSLEQVKRKSEDELHKAKLQFFTNISHEFRTPLTLILGPLQEILSSRRVDPRIREELMLVNRNAERLMRLINQLMDFRKLETGHMQLRAIPGDLVTFIRELAQSFEEYGRHRKIRFEVSAPPELMAWYDPDKLETVFNNLLANSFKYTPEGGMVRLEMVTDGPANWSSGDGASSGGTVSISVSDNGPGLSEKEQRRLFEWFYRARPGKGAKGTGIGLALARGIVELHQGTIEIESAEGQGTRFTVRLPLGREHLTDDQFAGDDSVVDEIESDLIFEEEEETPDEIASGLDGSPVVLVVDDNRDMRSFLRETLRQVYRVEEGTSGADGFERAVESYPDLIICDLMMPDMDGISLCRKLKEDLRTSHIPVLMLTANTSVDRQVESFETGADEYVTKPFNGRLLLARVKNLILTRQRLRERFSLDVPLRPEASGRSTQEEAFLQRVIEQIEARLSDPGLTVETLSQEIGMSRVYLHKKLKALTDRNPSEFIRMVRLNHAARLLLEGRLNVSEIAYEVGFNTPSHFATSFKKQYGQSPTDYVASFKTPSTPA